jgi:hypothetical protein
MTEVPYNHGGLITYHSRFIPEGVANVSQIFLRDTHVLSKFVCYEELRASEGKLSRWSRLHLQSLAPTNPHWARVVGYGPFSLKKKKKIHKEGLCPSSGDINRLMMMMMRNTADVIGGKPIAVFLLSIPGVSAINPLVAFYDIHGRKREVLLFYFVPDTTRDLIMFIYLLRLEYDCKG